MPVSNGHKLCLSQMVTICHSFLKQDKINQNDHGIGYGHGQKCLTADACFEIGKYNKEYFTNNLDKEDCLHFT